MDLKKAEKNKVVIPENDGTTFCTHMKKIVPYYLELDEPDSEKLKHGERNEFGYVEEAGPGKKFLYFFPNIAVVPKYTNYILSSVRNIPNIFLTFDSLGKVSSRIFQQYFEPLSNFSICIQSITSQHPFPNEKSLLSLE